MSLHAFSVDPRTVLSVGPDASLDEIRDAYHAKSKKHHPDAGGDEWAFRMVTQAYEVLKATAAASSPTSRRTTVADVGQGGHPPDWSRVWSSPQSKSGSSSPDLDDSSETGATGSRARNDRRDDDWTEGASEAAQSPFTEPVGLRTIDVELIWHRFEKAGRGRVFSMDDGEDSTLSVCMVISWPAADLVDRALEFSSTRERLRNLIELFETLRGQESVVRGRSRIEDGRFVGWLSYADVFMAQDAFLMLRETFRAQGLAIKLYTRDERIPFDWHGAQDESVVSHS
jgi:hypothetical protein